jgi:hypothetical protein
MLAYKINYLDVNFNYITRNTAFKKINFYYSKHHSSIFVKGFFGVLILHMPSLYYTKRTDSK